MSELADVGADAGEHRGVPATALLGVGPIQGSALGGKGSSLAQLIDAELPVPTTGVVTTAAYRAIAADPAVRALIDAIRNGEDRTAEEVDTVFLAVPVSAALETAILRLAERIGAGGAVAVRSSATVEDLAGSSFAGQYRSLLDVDANRPEAVLRAVRLVWASLWHPAPTAYRRAFEVDDEDVAMAVVVMRMIPATTAGVVFTADPGGRAGAARVEAVDGLGERLVSGQRTPRAWVVPRDRPGELPEAPRRALELALVVEAMHDAPQDVEWAAVEQEVSVVQARPITVLATDDGFDTPIDDHELTTAGIVEMVPGVLPPMRWELNQFLLEEAFRSVLDSLGLIRGGPAEDHPFVRRIRGRAAIDFDQLRAAASAMPGAVEELETQYFGRSADVAAPPPPRNRVADIRRSFRTLRTRRTAIDNADVLVGAVGALRTARPPVEALSGAELVRYLDRLVDLAARGLAAELAVAADAAATYRRLELMLGEHLGTDEATGAVQQLTTGAGAGPARATDASAAVFAGPTWDELSAVPPTPPPPDHERAADALRVVEERLTSLPGWTRRRVLTGQFVDLRIHLIRRTLAETRQQLHRRERTKAAFLELGGEVRRSLLELGRRLTQRGVCQAPTDIELLSLVELRRLTVQDGPGDGTGVDHDGPGADVIRRRRSWLGRYEAEGQLPVRFTGVPEREPAPMPEGDVLDGWAASPGRQRGRAKVVRAPTEQLAAGTVLVAEATDASWSPLFVAAAAIVVERGGPLSHAAILARELGIPAVLNVAGATRRLDGLTLTVDGDQGCVVIES